MKKLITIFFLTLCTILGAQSFRPVPHQESLDAKKTLNISRGVLLVDPQGTFAEDCSFLKLKSKGVFLNIDYGKSVAEQAGVKAVSGAYRIEITSKGITIVGYDEKGAFWGLQTLRRYAEIHDMRVPLGVVNDWPDSENRGFVEGFYGGTWSHEFRMSMVELATRLKIEEYVYAAKEDPYVAGEDWYLSYSQVRADELKLLMEACRKNRIDFTWCVRPDAEYAWGEADLGLIIGKFEMMHFLGVRSFGISFDDIPYFDGKEEKVKEAIDRINTDFIAKKKGLKPVLTDMSGYYVPAAGAESLKLGLYGTADRGWNVEAYDARESMQWAVKEIAPDVVEAYLTLARHSDVAPQSFGLKESDGYRLIGLDGYSADAFSSLMQEFKAIENAPAVISGSSNKALYEDLKPTLTEFGKLGTRLRRILECIDFYKKGDVPGFWSTYAANLMSDEEREFYQAYPSGKARLFPYFERMMKQLAEAFDEAYKGKVEYKYIPGKDIQTYIAPDEAALCHLILDNPEKHEVIVRLSDKKGKYTAEFCIDTSYFEFEMKDDAVNVEVIGDVKIFETVFVK